MKSVWLRSFFSAAFRSLWAPPQILFNQKPPYLAAIHQHNALSPTVRCRARFLFITAKCHELSSDSSWMGSLLSQPKANRLIRSRATCCVCPRGRQRFNTGEWATIFLGQLMCIWLYERTHMNAVHSHRRTHGFGRMYVLFGACTGASCASLPPLHTFLLTGISFLNGEIRPTAVRPTDLLQKQIFFHLYKATIRMFYCSKNAILWDFCFMLCFFNKATLKKT